MPAAEPRAPLPRWVDRTVGMSMLLIVGLVYLQAIGDRHWPPGHPWSGLTLSLLAVLSLFRQPLARPGGTTRGVLLTRAGLAMAFVSAVIWLVSAIVDRRAW